MAAISTYGIKSEEVMAMGEEMRKLDSANVIAVKAILDKYGWLGSDVIGDIGISALFLVIQHSDDTTHKYIEELNEMPKFLDKRVFGLMFHPRVCFQRRMRINKAFLWQGNLY